MPPLSISGARGGSGAVDGLPFLPSLLFHSAGGQDGRATNLLHLFCAGGNVQHKRSVTTRCHCLLHTHATLQVQVLWLGHALRPHMDGEGHDSLRLLATCAASAWANTCWRSHARAHLRCHHGRDGPRFPPPPGTPGALYRPPCSASAPQTAWLNSFSPTQTRHAASRAGAHARAWRQQRRTRIAQRTRCCCARRAGAALHAPCSCLKLVLGWASSDFKQHRLFSAALPIAIASCSSIAYPGCINMAYQAHAK